MERLCQLAPPKHPYKVGDGRQSKRDQTDEGERKRRIVAIDADARFALSRIRVERPRVGQTTDRHLCGVIGVDGGGGVGGIERLADWSSK